MPVAIITSASGEFMGLVTMEDLIEEIVGEIRDENDEEVPPIHRRGGGIVDVDGRVLLADLERDAHIVLLPEVKTVETVGGYMLGRLEHPPEAGERVECEGYARGDGCRRPAGAARPHRPDRRGRGRAVMTSAAPRTADPRASAVRQGRRLPSVRGEARTWNRSPRDERRADPGTNFGGPVLPWLRKWKRLQLGSCAMAR